MDTTHASHQGPSDMRLIRAAPPLSQVKLRGYRLELGEIEAAALAAPGVILAAAIVCTRGDAALARTTGGTRISHTTVSSGSFPEAKAVAAVEAAEAVEAVETAETAEAAEAAKAVKAVKAVEAAEAAKAKRRRGVKRQR